MNVLEKAIDKIMLAGIPCMAVPLLSSDCRNTRVDEAWVDEMVRTPFEPTAPVTRSYVHLMRGANELLQPTALGDLLPGLRTGAATDGDGPAAADPILGTQDIAVDFLARGGKHSRPFITLAAHDACSGGHGTHPDAGDLIATTPDRRIGFPTRCGGRRCRSKRFTKRHWFMMTSKTTMGIATASRRSTGRTAPQRRSTSVIT